MSIKLKIQPFSGSLETSKNVSFSLRGLDSTKSYKIVFENATVAKEATILSVDNGNIVDRNLYVSNISNVSGKLNLSISQHDSQSVMSIYANIYERNDTKYQLAEISAFNFMIENKHNRGQQKIIVTPSFLQEEDRATVRVKTKSNSKIQIIINDKRFLIKTNYAGDGSVSFRAADVAGIKNSHIKTLVKYQVYYATDSDNFSEVFDTGEFVHIIPSDLKSLQVIDTTQTPECVIFDAAPKQSLLLQTLEPFCTNSAIVGNLSLFNADDANSKYYNSKIGYCTPETSIFPATNYAVDRVYNSTHSIYLQNGTGVVVFSGQPIYNPDNPESKYASKVYIARLPSSLKYEGNSLRTGTILKPEKFIHKLDLATAESGDRFVLNFRIGDGLVFDIQYTSISGNAREVLSSLATAINTDTRLLDRKIFAVDHYGYLEIKSDTKFSIRTLMPNQIGVQNLRGFDVTLQSASTLQLLCTPEAMQDTGNTVVFHTPQLGYQYHSIASRDFINNIIYLQMPDGYNNNRGPLVTRSYYCQNFVIVNTDQPIATIPTTQIYELPNIKNLNGDPVSCVYPVITAVEKEIDGQNTTYLYIVCQAPIDGVYQLFLYVATIDRLGINEKYTYWRQLTQKYENKNARIVADSTDSLHMIWESDRLGSTNLYYSCIGSSSRHINNQVLMSILSKNFITNENRLLYSISAPTDSMQDTWTRILGANGAASVPNRNLVAVSGNPATDTAMVYYSLDKDQSGNNFVANFDQLSYQISFDLSVKNQLPRIDENQVKIRYNVWKAQFTPVGDYIYKRDQNLYTLDAYEQYYDNFIPFCGSLKLQTSNLQTFSGGTSVDKYPHNLSNTYASFNEKLNIDLPTNLKHFVLGLVPEKVKFKAKNIESFAQFCARNNLPTNNIDGYVNQIEDILLTGRYKLALLIATTNNERSGELARRNYIIHRLIDGVFDFENDKNITIAIHYIKMTQDYIDAALLRDDYSIAKDLRFQANIIIGLDRKIVCAESFAADFYDQYRQFDIFLGMPYGSSFNINEPVPYKGNIYENAEFTQIFKNVKISPHTVALHPEFFIVSKLDRDTSQIIQTNNVQNLLANNSFETTDLPYADATELFDGDTSIDSWSVTNRAIYRRNSNRYATTDSVGSDSNYGYRGSNSTSWIELTGTYTNSSNSYGAIQQTFTTVVGRKYYLYFDLANHPYSYQVSSDVTRKVRVSAASTQKEYTTRLRSTYVSPMNWRTNLFEFTATSTSTTITIENSTTSSGYEFNVRYGPQIDNLRLYDETTLYNERSSPNSWTSVGISEDAFATDYFLTYNPTITQIPITLYKNRQAINPSVYVDDYDKLHVAYQANIDNSWNIYYVSSRIRNEPFKYEKQISKTTGSAMNPAFAIDNKGRRLIAWQDNRDKFYQIYAAYSQDIDQDFKDVCKQNEADAFVAQTEFDITPYSDVYDAYMIDASILPCDFRFIVNFDEADKYHFIIKVYRDKNYTNLYRIINSADNIAGWKINDVPISYDGLSADANTQYEVSYLPSYEDGLTGSVFYPLIEYYANKSFIDINNSTNIEILYPYSGLDLTAGKIESSTNFRVIPESNRASSRRISPQNEATLNIGGISGISFESPLTNLPGVDLDQQIQSVLIHYDPPTSSGTGTCVIKFNKPIVALVALRNDMSITNDAYGSELINYTPQNNYAIEGNDTVFVSSDRLTLTLTINASTVPDQIRVLLQSQTTVLGRDALVYYCPNKQTARCDVSCKYTNNTDVAENINFRVTFYANVEKTDVILSTFTLFDSDNWNIGSNNIFPNSGVLVEPNESVSVSYVPEILSFEQYDSQVAQTNTSNNIVKQSLLCGVSYYVVVESCRNDVFYIEDEYEFICGCAKINDDRWGINKDKDIWRCSADGYEDFRITSTKNNCLNPKIETSIDNKFYIVWEDFRYARLLPNQGYVSPDYYMALFDANTLTIQSSGQGAYDKQITSYAENGLKLFNHSIHLDAFQNLNIVFNDSTGVYWKACSLGCKYRATINKLNNLSFTDQSYFGLAPAGNVLDNPDTVDQDVVDPNLFRVGNAALRASEQYQKMRLAPEYVIYSTYLDLTTPLPVVEDCYVELDIYGVPGTYAYRLRNEDSERWSEWLPIDSDLPEQPLPRELESDTNDGNNKTQAQIKSEQDFYKAYFISKERFRAPWKASSGQGAKRVCCEILTFFGKTDSFCVEFLAKYNKLEYKIDLYFDEQLTLPVNTYEKYRVIGSQRTDESIIKSNLSTLLQTTTPVDKIYVRVEFQDKAKVSSIDLTNMTMTVYFQENIQQRNLQLSPYANSAGQVLYYVGYFNVYNSLPNGLALISVDIPSDCNYVPVAKDRDKIAQDRLDMGETFNILEQKYSINNNFTIFSQDYIGDDLRATFANINYYRNSKYGSVTYDPLTGETKPQANINSKPVWLGNGNVVAVNRNFTNPNNFLPSPGLPPVSPPDLPPVVPVLPPTPIVVPPSSPPVVPPSPPPVVPPSPPSPPVPPPLSPPVPPPGGSPPPPPPPLPPPGGG